jgi:acyl-CoA thioesterase
MTNRTNFPAPGKRIGQSGRVTEPDLRHAIGQVGALENALAVRDGGPGTWVACADERYQARYGMFGGWTAAVALRSVLQSADGQDTPAALTINYIDAIAPGTEIIMRVRQIGGGRSVHHWQVDALTTPDERPVAVALVVLSERRPSDGMTQPSMPPVPAPEEVEEEWRPPIRCGEQVLLRPIAGFPPFGRHDTRSLAWVHETSGRRIDHVQLAFLSDAYPPRAFFWSDGPRTAATMSLSVYFHATRDEIASIGDDYVLNEATGTRGADSISGQQACLWSRNGTLLATTEQLVWYR